MSKNSSNLAQVLTSFYGIGPVLARKLIKEFKDLKLYVPGKEYTEKEVRELLLMPHIYTDLPDMTKVDLREEPVRSMPHEKIALLDEQLHKYVHDIHFIIAGSYIRGKPMSGDIDMILVVPDARGQVSAEAAHRAFIEFQRMANRSEAIHIDDPFSSGAGKITTLVNIQSKKIKADIFLTAPNEYIFALTYAIGSGRYNLRTRAQAKRKGFLLNQHGLFRKSKDKSGKEKLVRVPIKNERELFEKLGMTYREPKDRV